MAPTDMPEKVQVSAWTASSGWSTGAPYSSASRPGARTMARVQAMPRPVVIQNTVSRTRPDTSRLRISISAMPASRGPTSRATNTEVAMP